MDNEKLIKYLQSKSDYHYKVLEIYDEDELMKEYTRGHINCISDIIATLTFDKRFNGKGE